MIRSLPGVALLSCSEDIEAGLRNAPYPFGLASLLSCQVLDRGSVSIRHGGLRLLGLRTGRAAPDGVDGWDTPMRARGDRRLSKILERWGMVVGHASPGAPLDALRPIAHRPSHALTAGSS